MRCGKVVSREEYMEIMRLQHSTEQHIEAWKQDNRGDHTVQMHLVCGRHHRTLCLTLPALTHLYDPEEDTNKSLPAAFARTWQDLLIEQTEHGQPGFEYSFSRIRNLWNIHCNIQDLLRDISQ